MAHFLTNIFFSGSHSNSESHLVLVLCLLNLFQYVTIPQSLSFNTLTFLKITDHLFGRISCNVDLSDVFSWLRLCISGKNTPEVTCPFQSILLGGK